MKRARSSVLNTALILLWLNFVLLWDRVHHDTSLNEALGSVGYLGAMLSVYALILAVWVYHNLRIWRIKGPRTNLRSVSSVITHDALLRLISRTVDLESEQDIRVHVLGNRKFFSNGALQSFTLNIGELEAQAG